MGYLHKPSQESHPVIRSSHLSPSSPLSYFKCRGRKQDNFFFLFFSMQKAPKKTTNSNENFGLNSQFSHCLVTAFSLKCDSFLAREL